MKLIARLGVCGLVIGLGLAAGCGSSGGGDDTSTVDGSMRDGGRDSAVTVDGAVAIDGALAIDGAAAIDGAMIDAALAIDGAAIDAQTADAQTGDAQTGPDGAVGSCGVLTETETGATRGNDTAATAQALPGVGSYHGELQVGADKDFYSFAVATAGTLMHFDVTTSGGGGMDAAFVVSGPAAAPLSRVSDNPVGLNTGRDVFFPAAGTYTIAIADHRTFLAAPPTVTAGTFCYQLTITQPAAPTPALLALPAVGATTTATHSVTANGLIGFFRVTLPATRSQLLVVNAAAQAATQAAGGTTHPDVDTIVTVWDPTALRVVSQNDDSVAADTDVEGNTNSNLATLLTSEAAAKDYWVLVDHYTLNNDDVAASGAAAGLQSDVTLTLQLPIPVTFPFTTATGTLNAARQLQWYDVTDLPGRLVTATANGTTGMLTDVGVGVMDGSGAFLDFAAPGAAAAIVTAVPLASDRSLIMVMAFDDLVNPGTKTGAYTLAASEAACAAISGARAPAAGELAINEVLHDPADPLTGDANGDGVSDQQQDEFVELVNTSTAVLDLSGVSLSDSNGATAGVRHVFACGTALAPGRAAVVFGGGSPRGTFGSSEVEVANVSLTCGVVTRGLCLNNATAESVTVRAAASPPSSGAVLGTLPFTGFVTNADTSYVRCSSATPANPAACDTGASYVRHNTIPTVTAAQSPGTKVSGAPFDFGGSCQAPSALLAAGTVPGSTLGLGNRYDTPCLTGGSAGNDHVYSISVPGNMRLNATVTPVTAGFDPAIYLVASPANLCDATPMVCLDADDTGVEDQPDTSTYVNPGATPQTVFIVVDSYYGVADGDPGDSYTLTTAFAAP